MIDIKKYIGAQHSSVAFQNTLIKINQGRFYTDKCFELKKKYVKMKQLEAAVERYSTKIVALKNSFKAVHFN